MKKIRRLILPAVLLCSVAAIPVGLFRITFKSHRANEPNREALMRILEHGRVALTEDEFQALVEANKTDELTLVKFDDLYEIHMPLELGAKDWRLLAPVENGRIKGLMIRTTDRPKPEGSPRDKK